MTPANAATEPSGVSKASGTNQSYTPDSVS